MKLRFLENYSSQWSDDFLYKSSLLYLYLYQWALRNICVLDNFCIATCLSVNLSTNYILSYSNWNNVGVIITPACDFPRPGQCGLLNVLKEFNFYLQKTLLVEYKCCVDDVNYFSKKIVTNFFLNYYLYLFVVFHGFFP